MNSVCSLTEDDAGRKVDTFGSQCTPRSREAQFSQLTPKAQRQKQLLEGFCTGSPVVEAQKEAEEGTAIPILLGRSNVYFRGHIKL